MQKSVIWKLAASGLVLATTAIGCKPASDARPQAASAGAPTTAKAAAAAASRATKALAISNMTKAVKEAELAVLMAPDHAPYRALLGQAYLASGRFASAEASFRDAVTLDPATARPRVSLALAEIALGRAAAARATLAEAAGKAPEADRGLALALAGDAPGAVTVLEAAARAPGADAKTRQNLALAYALAGEWAKAQATAAQDLSPADVTDRITTWASFAKPKAPADQVASLLGVLPAVDPGRPERLALVVEPAPEPVQVAAAEPAPAAPAPFTAVEPARAAPVPFAAAKTTPVFYAAPAPLAPAPLIRAPRETSKVAAAPVPRRRAAQSFVRQSGGNWAVQLGAFRATTTNVAWGKVRTRFGGLATYTPSTSRIEAHGATLTRLALTGFATRDDATKVCLKLRAAGGDCFVRTTAGDAPVQMVARKRPIQVASRKASAKPIQIASR